MRTETKTSTIIFEQRLAVDIDEVTKSPQFTDWAGANWQDFGEVITEAGKPVIFYHGGSSGIREFNRDTPRNTGDNMHGIYFSPTVQNAKFYAGKLKSEQIEEGQNPDASLYAVFLKLNNPYVVEQGSGISSANIEKIPEGYDGFVNKMSHEVVVFDPSQIFIVAKTER